MRTIDISLTGGDSATYYNNSRRVSRLWLFPDGIRRIITMSQWHWDTHDRLIFEEDDPNYFSTLAYDASMHVQGPNHPEFEEWIHTNFRDGVSIAADNTNTSERRAVNANNWYWSPTPMRLLKSGGLAKSFHNARDGKEAPPEYFN